MSNPWKVTYSLSRLVTLQGLKLAGTLGFLLTGLILGLDLLFDPSVSLLPSGLADFGFGSSGLIVEL